MYTYFIRYLPSKENGLGSLIFTIASSEEKTLSDIREGYPEVFGNPGFYSLLKAEDQQINISKDK